MTASVTRSGPRPGLPSQVEVHARRRGENFPVALWLLPPRTRRNLLAIYGYARLVDDVGDEVEGDRHEALDRVAAQLDAVFSGGRPAHPVFAAVSGLVADCDVPRGPFDRLLAANRRDQERVDLADFGELLAYCRLSASPVGQLVLSAFGAVTPDRLAMSDRVCGALQILEHVQDVAEDAGRGRIYLPRTDRRALGIADDDLLAVPAPPPVRRLAAINAERAEAMLEEAAPLVETLTGTARLAVAGYVAGGRATVRALAADGYRHLDGRVRARARDVLAGLVATTARGR